MAAALKTSSALIGLFVLALTAQARSQTVGVTATEIKLGQTMPYSGALSAWGQIGKAYNLYIEKMNADGGVNGRKINLMSLDDGYSPPKAVEQTRRLVEQDEVLAMVGSLGTAQQTAVRKYLNIKKVPQLFVITGSSRITDPKNFPWTIGITPTYETEAKIYARYVLQTKPDAKVAILFQNDDLGREYARGFKEALGDHVKEIVVGEASYDVTDPVVDSQIISLKATGANVLFIAAGSKYTSQAIRRTFDLDWHPLQFVISPSNSVASVLEIAGAEQAKGVISASYYKDPTDPQWGDDPAYKEWLVWMKTYNPGGDITDAYNVHGYIGAQLLVELLRRCGNDLSRANLVRTATTLKDLKLGMMIPGIVINTTPEDPRPIRQLKLQRFDGKKFVPFGDVING
ncbi:ABC transporter substrate-binding protein [Bradyrhizobium sp. AZCC 2230]|uniref:ABC transporter substrate-binding protein n=1 Tax=Bradyrhizobium sp. AZCC 2230 TaxID=3117021 RepID=UPI002FEF76D9